MSGTRSRPTRAGAAISAALIAVAGLLVQRGLVLNPSDNAYLYLWTAGFGLLYLCAPPYAIAAALPAGLPRRIAASVGAGLLWAIVALFLALTAPFLVLSFIANPSLNPVFLVHLAGVALALGCALYGGFWIFR
ncbi:MAG: hypothetical protein U0531_01570 [Dehalococcoidia bacterium]